MDDTSISEAAQRLGMASDEAAIQTEFFLAEAYDAAPCLRSETDPEKVGLARAIIVGAIERRIEARRAVVQSQRAGRQSETIRPASVPEYSTDRFTAAELARLARICGASSPVPVSRGNFPPPSDRLRNLFGHV